VDLRIAVVAAVPDDHEPVVGVGGVPDGREQDGAGGDAGEEGRLDAVGA
jgi:hypothetical protein